MKELKFKTMNIEVELHITVYVDNEGAIWLSNNRITCDKTKHMDIRTSFVKEYQEDGKIIIKFVKSGEMRQTYSQRISQTLFSKDTKRSYSGTRKK